jgi:hypothetical protein
MTRVLSRVPKPEQREEYFVTQDGLAFGDYDTALHNQGGSGPIERVEVVETIQPEPKKPREYWIAGDGALERGVLAFHLKSEAEAEIEGAMVPVLIHVREVTK